MSVGQPVPGNGVGVGAGAVSTPLSAGDLRAVATSLAGGPMQQRAEGAAGAAPAAGRARLGEELPIFCERCGYALHGLPQQRCDRCAILHFSCPECGHHQPINTLRPAAQRVLGRLRAFVLGIWVFIKLNFFFWLLFAWFGMGVEWSYRFNSYRDPTNPNNWRYQAVPRDVDIEAGVAFAIFALAFGMVGRMMLLRFRRGWAVGGVLGALVLMASYLGAWFRVNVDRPSHMTVALPIGLDFQLLLLGAALTIVFAAVVVWPIWLALTHLFLPSRTASALLDWQRSMSSAAPILARQE